MNKWQEAGGQLLAEHGLRIRNVRHSMSGLALFATPEIDCPLPKSAKSFRVLAHEVGHKALNHARGHRSCVREYEADQFAIEQFRRFGLTLPREVKHVIDEHIAYGLAQALNRGMKRVPDELKPYRRLLRPYHIFLIYPNGRSKRVRRYHMR